MCPVSPSPFPRHPSQPRATSGLILWTRGEPSSGSSPATLACNSIPVERRSWPFPHRTLPTAARTRSLSPSSGADRVGDTLLRGLVPWGEQADIVMFGPGRSASVWPRVVFSQGSSPPVGPYASNYITPVVGVNWWLLFITSLVSSG